MSVSNSLAHFGFNPFQRDVPGHWVRLFLSRKCQCVIYQMEYLPVMSVAGMRVSVVLCPLAQHSHKLARNIWIYVQSWILATLKCAVASKNNTKYLPLMTKTAVLLFLNWKCSYPSRVWEQNHLERLNVPCGAMESCCHVRNATSRFGNQREKRKRERQPWIWRYNIESLSSSLPVLLRARAGVTPFQKSINGFKSLQCYTMWFY